MSIDQVVVRTTSSPALTRTLVAVGTRSSSITEAAAPTNLKPAPMICLPAGQLTVTALATLGSSALVWLLDSTR